MPLDDSKPKETPADASIIDIYDLAVLTVCHELKNDVASNGTIAAPKALSL
jgi:hypothetical protein